jgi:hypothetical protein
VSFEYSVFRVESEPDRRTGTASKADGRRKAVGFDCSSLLSPQSVEGVPSARHLALKARSVAFAGARGLDTSAFRWPQLNR